MAEPSVDPLVPHLFLLSLTLFPLPPLCPLPGSFNLMVLMDSVVHHDLFDHLFDGPAAALRCAGIGSDWNRIGSDRMGARVASRVYMAWLSMVGVPFHCARSSRIDRHDHQSVGTLPFGLAHTTTKHALRV